MARKTFAAGDVLAAADVNTYLSNEAIYTATTAAAYTAVTGDRYKTFDFTNTTAGVVTIGTATAFQAGERFDIIRSGTATLTISAGTGVTFSGNGTAGTAYAIATQYSAATVLCSASNNYRVIGQITTA